MNTNKIATGSVNKKLLAALAVLAVAFVVLAAVPAVATDSDAEGESSVSSTAYAGGTIYVSDTGTAEAAASTAQSPTTLVKAITAANSATGASIIRIVGTVQANAGETADPVKWDAATNKSTVSYTGSQALTIQGNSGTSDRLVGYVLYLTSASGDVTIQNVTLEDGATSTNAQVVLASGYTKDLKVSNAQILLTGKASATPNWSAKSVEVYTTGTVDIQNTVFTSNLTDLSGTVEDRTTAVDVQANSGTTSKLVFKNNTITGYSRGVNADSVNSIDTAGNTYSLIYNGYEDSKAFSIASNNATSNDQSVSIGTDKSVSFTNSDDYKSNGEAGTYGAVIGHYTMILSSFTSAQDVTVLADAKKPVITVTGTFTMNAGTTLYLAGPTGEETTGATILASTSTSGATAKVQINGDIVADRGSQILTGTSGSISLRGTETLDADQSTPIVLKAGTSGVTYTAAGNFSTTIAVGVASGSIELVSGNFTVPSIATVTIGENTSVTVDSGASVLVAQKTENNTNSARTDAIVNNGTLRNNGVIAYAAATTSGESNDIKTINDNLKIVGNKAQKAFSVSTSAGDNTEIIKATGEGLVYAGQKYTVTVQTSGNDKANYKIGTVTAMMGSIEVPVTDNGDGTYTFTVPASSTADIIVSSTAVGAYSTTFYLVYDDGTARQTYSVVSGIADADGTTIASVSTPSVTGYSFVGWYYYKDNVLTAVTDNGTGDSAVKSLAFYGMLQKYYSVTVDINDKNGGTVTPMDGTAVDKGSVQIKIKPTVNKYVLGSVSVNGVAVDFGTADNGVYTYNVVIDKADAVVSVVFDKIYNITNGSPQASGTTTNTSYIVISSVTDSTNGKTAVAGEKVTVKITAADDKELKTLKYSYMASKTAIKATEVPINADAHGDYVFTMPAYDITVTATFGDAYILSYTAQDNVTVSATVNGNAVRFGVTKIAAEATVVLTVTPASGYAVSEIKAGDSVTLANGKVVSAGNGTYTFSMPEAATTLTVTPVAAYTVEKVIINGNGNVVYDEAGLSVAPGGEIAFTVKTDDNTRLESYAVYADAEMKTAAGNATWDPVSGSAAGVYTLTLATSSANPVVTKYYVLFTFEDLTYSDITVVDKTDATLANVKVYSDSGLKTEVALTDGKATVANGTYYITIAQKTGYDIVNASAVYDKDKITQAATETTAAQYAHHAGQAVNVTTVNGNSDPRVYSISVDDDMTITANYKAHETVISFSDPANGKLTVTDTATGKAIASGDKVPYGHVLSLSTEADTGYILDEYAVAPKAAGEVAHEGNDYTYTVGMTDATISANTAVGFKVNVVEVTGATVTATPDEGKANTTVTLTFKAQDGYKITSVTYGSTAATAAQLTAGTLTFTLTADTEVITTVEATGDQPVAATSLIISSTSKTISVIGVDGYVPEGTITLYAVYTDANGVQDLFEVVLNITNSQQSNVVTVTPTTTDANASAVFGIEFEGATFGSIDQGSLDTFGFASFAFRGGI